MNALPVASPGFKVVRKTSVPPLVSIVRTRSERPVFAIRRITNAAGHSSTGAVKYQTANVTGSQRKTVMTKRASGFPAGAVTSVLRRDRKRAGRVASITIVGLRDARQRAHPDHPHDEDVQHDQSLPQVEVRPLEHVAIPLTEIEEAHHA